MAENKQSMGNNDDKLHGIKQQSKFQQDLDIETDSSLHHSVAATTVPPSRPDCDISEAEGHSPVLDARLPKPHQLPPKPIVEPKLPSQCSSDCPLPAPIYSIQNSGLDHNRQSKSIEQISGNSPDMHSAPLALADTTPLQDRFSSHVVSPFNIYDVMEPSCRQQLSEIVHDHNILPLKLVFCDSFSGVCGGSFDFLKDEMIEIHFMKETLMANVQVDMKSGMKLLKIPLYVADLQFTLEYSSDVPRDNDFTSSQLIKLAKLPKVAFVKQDSKETTKSSEFVKWEVLVLQNRINKSSVIECFSLSSRTKKIIHKSSDLFLTVNPSQVTFSFLELIHFDFPLQVRICTSSGIPQQRTYTINSTSMEKSLIASFSNHELHEIFFDVPFDFQIAQLSEQERKELIKKSKVIYESFIPTGFQSVTDSPIPLQKKIYDMPATTSNDWKEVVTLYQPKSFKSKQGEFEKHISPSPTGPREDDDLVSVSEIIMHPNTCYISTPVKLPLSKPKVISCHETSNALSECPTNVYMLQAKKECLKLEELTENQVLDLLDKLGLTQYKEVFIKEQISGDLLMELDEEVLEHELKITSKLHRVKLLQVIRGNKSLDSLFRPN